MHARSDGLPRAARERREGGVDECQVRDVFYTVPRKELGREQLLEHLECII